MTRAVRVPRGRAPRGCARLSTVLLVIVVLAGAVPRTLAMRGAFASAFRSAERTLQEKGLLPHPDATRQRPRRRGRIPTPDDVRGRGRRRGGRGCRRPRDGRRSSLPPAERLFRAATRLLDDRPDSARAQRRAATSPRGARAGPEPSRRAHGARPRDQAGEGVDVDDALALTSSRRAASLGDPARTRSSAFAHST